MMATCRHCGMFKPVGGRLVCEDCLDLPDEATGAVPTVDDDDAVVVLASDEPRIDVIMPPKVCKSCGAEWTAFLVREVCPDCGGELEVPGVRGEPEVSGPSPPKPAGTASQPNRLDRNGRVAMGIVFGFVTVPVAIIICIAAFANSGPGPVTGGSVATTPPAATTTPVATTTAGANGGISATIDAVNQYSASQVQVQVTWTNDGSSTFDDASYSCTLTATPEDGGGYGVIQVKPEYTIAAGGTENDGYLVTVTNNDALDVLTTSDVSLGNGGD